MAELGRPSFWTTLPGILTGIAAIVTAVTGLIVGVSQLRSRDSSGDRADVPTATVREEPSRPSPSGSAPANAAPVDASKKESMVVITGRDGQITTVYASSFRHHQVPDVLPLLSGQSIPFERIRAIEVTRHESDQARVDVTLVNGRMHSGFIASGLSPFGFSGDNDLGRFDIRVDQLSRIVFER